LTKHEGYKHHQVRPYLSKTATQGSHDYRELFWFHWEIFVIRLPGRKILLKGKGTSELKREGQNNQANKNTRNPENVPLVQHGYRHVHDKAYQWR
jgi:hypothetical protein